MCSQDSLSELTEEQSVVFICLGRHTKTTIPEFTGDEVAVGAISSDTDGLLCSLISVVGVCCTNEGGERLPGAASGEGRGDRRAEGWEEQHPGSYETPVPEGHVTRGVTLTNPFTHTQWPTSLKIRLSTLCNTLKWDTLPHLWRQFTMLPLTQSYKAHTWNPSSAQSKLGRTENPAR